MTNARSPTRPMPWASGTSLSRARSAARFGSSGALQLVASDAEDGVDEERGAAPQGVHEDGRDAHGHGDHRPDRVDEAGRGERDADAVEGEGQGHVLHHFSVAVPTDLTGQQDQAEPSTENDDVGGFDR